MPKFSTHLVYLTKADSPRNVERQIIDSILARKVKRADIYWFVHVNYTDAPYTMDYRVQELIDDKVIRVDFDLGFRVQPRVNMLFRKVMSELHENKELEKVFQQLAASGVSIDDYALVQEESVTGEPLPTKYAWRVVSDKDLSLIHI